MSTENNKYFRMSSEEMELLSHIATKIVIEHFQNVNKKVVMNRASRHELESKLNEPIPLDKSNFVEILNILEQDILTNIAHLDHSRFFAFVPGSHNFASVIADFLSSGFNVFAGSWLGASAPAQIELVTIDWLRQLCNLPDTAGGLFVSGGSMANLIALATARKIKLNDNIENAVVYFSDQAHSSIIRALKILGFKANQLRTITSDANYRLDLSSLKEAIHTDRENGLLAFCLIANAGTTNTGAIDPLLEVSELCDEEKLWLHIDGAIGTPVVISPSYRYLMNGLNKADSITLDPHKWLFQPYEIGCLLIKDKFHLKEAFSILPDYLGDSNRTDGEEINYCNYGIQLTRSFRALKIWMSFKLFGLNEFISAIEKCIYIAKFTENLLHKMSYWKVTSSTSLCILTFRYEVPNLDDEKTNDINQIIVDTVIRSGFAMLSTTILNHRKVIRMCTMNPNTSEDDIQKTISKLDEIARSLTPSSYCTP